MVPCGLAGHRQCTVSVSSHTIHLRRLRVVNLFSSSFLALNNCTEFCWILFITIVTGSFFAIRPVSQMSITFFLLEVGSSMIALFKSSYMAL